MFNISILEPKVCATPTFRNTLITLLVSKILRTLSVSVELPTPILIDPPTETVDGILLTNTSWTKPLELPTVIDFPSDTVSVLTPILNEFVKFVTDVLNPETKTESLSLSSTNGR